MISFSLPEHGSNPNCESQVGISPLTRTRPTCCPRYPQRWLRMAANPWSGSRSPPTEARRRAGSRAPARI